MNYLESSEDYLERILMLQKEMGSIRAIDIANSMEFSRASVSIALKKLKEKEMVNISEANGIVTLTEKGLEIAKSIYERHEILSSILEMIGVSKETALADACKIEHDISEETFDRIKFHVKEYKK